LIASNGDVALDAKWQNGWITTGGFEWGKFRMGLE
jgi:hypothetical protein